jgi:hypothetical protein
MPLVGGETVTRRRFAAGTRVGGRYVEDPAPVDTLIIASFQAPSGDDMQILPEGTRAEEARKAYTWVDVRTEDQHTGISADQLIVDGIVYQVVHVWPWRPAAPIPHHKCLVVRLQEADTPSP